MKIKDERLLEELIADEKAKEMQESIDFEIISDLYVKAGWTEVKVQYGPNCRWIDVMAWVDSIRIGDYQERNGRWLFERKEDATMFTLRWA